MGNVARRPDGRWRARFRDVRGREHSKHFDRKIDAVRWLAGVEVARSRASGLIRRCLGSGSVTGREPGLRVRRS